METYRVIGIESSPYAVKVRAVLRYRRIPHIWVARMPQFFKETQHLRPLLMPAVQFPGGDYHTDSTPIIRQFEERHAGRSIIPPDPATAFVSDLIEDMADEWLTKCLFHYRFSYAPDAQVAASWVMDDAHPGLSETTLRETAHTFKTRQIERMPLVGCTPVNGPLFEAFFRRVLACLRPFVATDRFLFGTRPSLADFGLFGQLRTLTRDPTPGREISELAPRLRSWVRRLDDASGVEGEWNQSVEASNCVSGLLELVGQYYLPYLVANEHAVKRGKPSFELTLGGHTYTQASFRYQAKCYGYLLSAWNGLSAEAQSGLRPLLDTTGCTANLAR